VKSASHKELVLRNPLMGNSPRQVNADRVGGGRQGLWGRVWLRDNSGGG
jgi:hypothetical protein